MQDDSSGPTVTYLVTVHREQAGTVEVTVDGPDDDEGKETARQAALYGGGPGRALVWATVGDPYVVSVEVAA